MLKDYVTCLGENSHRYFHIMNEILARLINKMLWKVILKEKRLKFIKSVEPNGFSKSDVSNEIKKWKKGTYLYKNTHYYSLITNKYL